MPAPHGTALSLASRVAAGRLGRCSHCQPGLAWTLGVRAREGALGSSSSPNNSLLGLFVLAGVDQCVAIEDPSTDGRAACPFLRGVQVHSGAILSQASLNVDPVPREVLSSS
jgi:hypothetical protein